jgi:hypothetical protein
MTSLRQAQTSTLQRAPFFAGTKEYSFDEYHSAYTHYGSYCDVVSSGFM